MFLFVQDLYRLLIVWHIIRDLNRWVMLDMISNVFPQHWHIKYIVKPRKAQSQSHSICHCANLLYNLKRHNKLMAKFTSLSKTKDSFPRWDFQENIIPNLELQITSTSISITLLPTLSYTETLSYQLNFVNSDLNWLYTFAHIKFQKTPCLCYNGSYYHRQTLLMAKVLNYLLNPTHKLTTVEC